MPDDTFENKDDVWAQGADDDWETVLARLTESGALTLTAVPTRSYVGARILSGDL